MTLVVAPLAAASAVFFWDGPPQAAALDKLVAGITDRDRPAGVDRERARFEKCDRPSLGTCVVDGDTIRYGGVKIRIADINTPETYEAKCAAERRLGNRATQRMIVLLNAGPFTLAPADRETDQYGRTLRVVTRGGESLGAVLVEEGLAETWQGYRREWC